jgi:hypothetical protein
MKLTSDQPGHYDKEISSFHPFTCILAQAWSRATGTCGTSSAG